MKKRFIKLLTLGLGAFLIICTVGFTGITAIASETTGQEISFDNTDSGEQEEEVIPLPQNNKVTLYGKEIKSTLDGNYLAWSVPGFAVITPLSDLQKQANFMILEYFYVTTWDISVKNAPLCIDTMQTVADLSKAELGAAFQIKVSRLFSTKVYPYENEELQVGTTIEIPADFRQEGAKYAIVSVKSGGYFDILTDNDEDPNTITFIAHGGTGAYGILRFSSVDADTD